MVRRPLSRREALVGVVGITVVGFLARFFALGFRVFHWDEGRVGYWILRYAETGVWEYHAILHGPFLFHVNSVLFDVFGPTDVTARAVVAFVGGLLPLAAWLFRDHLEPVEVVVAGAFLALNPILLYFSRFMRNDVLTAAFGLVAIGLFLRLWDTRRHRYLFGGVFFLGLGFATKEILVVYVGVWVGAVLLLFDHRLFTATARNERWQATALSYGRALARWAKVEWPWVFLAMVEFVLLVVFFYAPRPELYQALGNPAQLPGVLNAATLGTWQKLEALWISGGHEHSYVEFLRHALSTTAFTSLPLAGFAIIGFLIDRYAGDRPRDLVAFAFYWGLPSSSSIRLSRTYPQGGRSFTWWFHCRYRLRWGSDSSSIGGWRHNRRPTGSASDWRH